MDSQTSRGWFGEPRGDNTDYTGTYQVNRTQTVGSKANTRTTRHLRTDFPKRKGGRLLRSIAAHSFNRYRSGTSVRRNNKKTNSTRVAWTRKRKGIPSEKSRTVEAGGNTFQTCTRCRGGRVNVPIRHNVQGEENPRWNNQN